MPQAKRIKAKPKAKKNAKPKGKQTKWPWGLLLVVLISGVVLAKLLYGAKTGDSSFGSGLRAVLDQNKRSQDEDTQAIQDLVAKSTEKEFDFYDVLPDIETVMPDDVQDTEPVRAEMDYFVQAASFRKNADAERLRARLALKGFKSSTQERTTEERGTFFRVRLGPFGKREAKTVKNQLQRLGISPIVVSVKKNR